MKRIILAVAISMTLSGCATATLPNDATPEQKRQALCSDARNAIMTGEIGLSVAASPAQSTYWQRWLDGARKVLALQCGE